MAFTWCLQCNKRVNEDTIVFLILPTGKKRRMCSKCKADALERRKINNIKLGFQKRT